MFRYNDRFNGKYINQFLKNVPIEPHTEYTLTFDSLGGAIGFWVNHCFAKPEEQAYYFDRCAQWTAHTIHFTTNGRLEKQVPFSNWGLSFFKKMNSRYITGDEDSYVDNVRLFKAEEPERDLLCGGDFEAPRDSEVYLRNWYPSFFGPGGKDFGIDIVTDPLDVHNHCLLLPRLIQPPVYPIPMPIQVSAYGYYKEVGPVDICHRDPLGSSDHRLVFVERGEIVFNGAESFTVTAGSGVYLPAGVPAQFTYRRGKNTEYHWITFGGAEAEALMQQTGIPIWRPFFLPDSSVFTKHIGELLQFPADSVFYPYAASGHLQVMLAQLSRITIGEVPTDHELLIEQVAARLREHPELPTDNAALAESCGFSVGHFIRLFKQYEGCTPHQYRQQILMQQAGKLLRETTMSVKEIAFTLGIDNPLYFSNAFRQFHGSSPREYRKQKE